MAEYFKHEIAKWNVQTDDLTLEQEAAYHRVVSQIRLYERPFRENYRVLSGLWRCNERRAKRILAELIEAGKLTVEGGYIIDEKAVNDASMLRQSRVHKQLAGRQGGIESGKSRSKSLENKETSEAHASTREEKAREEKRIEGGGGSASAREPTFREQILEVAGADPTTGLTGRGGQMIGRSDETAEIHSAMSNLVITEAEALAVITDAMARKQASRDPGPPSSLRFFVPALERYAAARDAPPRKPTRPRKPEVPLPPDWVPSEKNLADAKQRNLSPSEIDHEANQFRNFHTSHDTRYRDWDAAWRTWLGNVDRRQGPGPRNTGPGAGHSALLAGFRWAAGEGPSGG